MKPTAGTSSEGSGIRRRGCRNTCRSSYRGYLQVFTGNEICHYLGSRFYSPALGRFLNADVYQDTAQGVVGTNMFAYCNNNPVMMVDPNGDSSFVALEKCFNALRKLVITIQRILPVLNFNNNNYGYITSPVGNEGQTAYGDRIKFTSTQYGVSDITVFSNKNLLIAVYIKKYKLQGLLPKEEYQLVDTFYGKDYKYICNSALKTEIYVCVTCNDPARVTCKINQHQDNLLYSKGAKWEAKEDSGYPNALILYDMMWYIDKDYIADFLKVISNEQFVVNQENYIAGILDFYTLVLSIIINPASAGVIISMVNFVYQRLSSSNMINSTISNIIHVSEYNSNTKKANYGIVIQTYIAQGGTTGISVKKWSGDRMTGASGRIGDWTKNV